MEKKDTSGKEDTVQVVRLHWAIQVWLSGAILRGL